MNSNWPEVRLGDHIDSCLGKMLDKKKNKGTLQPYLGNSNVRWGTFELDDLAEMRFEESEFDRYSLKQGDLVVCEGGEPGRCAIWEGETEEMKIQKALHRVRPKENLDNYYLYYWFLHAGKTRTLEPYFTGTTIKHLTGKALSELPIRIPPMEVQQRCAEVLKSLDKKIRQNTRINQTLEEMAQAIFKSWFVDFDPVKAKMNGEQPEGVDAATASLFPEKLVESELGLIPEGWSVSTLESLVDIASSKRIFAKEYLEEGVPFFRGKEITELSKGNSVKPEIYISEERYQELKDKSGAPKEGDILITSVGTIGNTYLVDSEDKFYFKDGNLTWVRGYKDDEIPYFLMEWFKSKVGKHAIENIKIGSTQQAITIKSLNGIKLVSPSSEIHEKFTQLIEPLYQKHRANIKQSKALAELRDTLLPKLLLGEIELETATEN